MIVLFREVSDEVSQSGFHRSEIDFTPISADSISVFLIIAGKLYKWRKIFEIK